MARISTRFGFSSTAAEVVSGIDLSTKRAVVTGGAGGVGIETARALAGAGASVVLAVRDLEAGERAASAIRASTGRQDVEVRRLDLTDLDSIRRFAAEWSGPLHLLVNNAAVMATPETRTREGWELQFATNHLGHFALTVGLREALARAAPARVVSVSSTAHKMSPVIFDDIHFRFRPYDPFLAYAQSKTANALFAVALTARWRGDGILSNALTPGAIETNLQRHAGGIRTPPEGRKTPEQGAATSVLLATSPLLEGVGGRYFADCNEAEPVSERTPGLGGVAPYALDPQNAERLWEESTRLLEAAG